MNRRTFLGSATLTGAAFGRAPALLPRTGTRSGVITPAVAAEQRVLRAVTRSLDINGRSASAFGLIGDDGKPGLAFSEGDQFSVALINKLSEPTHRCTTG